MPAGGVKLLQHNEILSYEEIVDIVKYAVSNGIRKVRLTGGEPLVRREFTTLVSMIAEISGIDDLSMTTNGVFLEKHADNLAQAGLNRVNVSLDTLNPEKYRKITRGGNLNAALKGIQQANHVGLNPIKINMVINEFTDDKDKEQLTQFCNKNGYTLRFIHQMNLKSGCFSVITGGRGGDCPRCNRLRLTSNGKIKPCLFSDLAYDVRKLGIEKAFQQALENKPYAGSFSETCSFNRIGG